MDVLKALCGEIVIQCGQELSLALGERNSTDDSATQC